MPFLRTCLCVCLAGAMVVSGPPAGVARGIDAGPHEYRYDEILGFARHCAANGEYYRAYVELQRLQSYYPSRVNHERLYAAGLYLQYGAGRYADIVSGVSAFPRSGDRCVAAVFEADARIAISDYGGARDIASGYAYNSDEPLLAAMHFKRLLLSSMLLFDIDGSRRMLCDERINALNKNDLELYATLVKYADSTAKSLKNPHIAAINGIIPGMGYAYSGNASTGIIAFLAVAVLSGLAYGAAVTDNGAMCVCFGLGATALYAGSVVGGWREAVRYNEARMRRYSETLVDDMNCGADRDALYRRYGM